MAKFQGFSYFTLKVTASFWKVITKIFVNPGICESVKTDNGMISSKIIIFEQNLDR